MDPCVSLPTRPTFAHFLPGRPLLYFLPGRLTFYFLPGRLVIYFLPERLVIYFLPYRFALYFLPGRLVLFFMPGRLVLFLLGKKSLFTVRQNSQVNTQFDFLFSFHKENLIWTQLAYILPIHNHPESHIRTADPGDGTNISQLEGRKDGGYWLGQNRDSKPTL